MQRSPRKLSYSHTVSAHNRTVLNRFTRLAHTLLDCTTLHSQQFSWQLLQTCTNHYLRRENYHQKRWLQPTIAATLVDKRMRGWVGGQMAGLEGGWLDGRMAGRKHSFVAGWTTTSARHSCRPNVPTRNTPNRVHTIHNIHAIPISHLHGQLGASGCLGGLCSSSSI